MSTVRIGDREFRVGAWYEPQNKNAKKPSRMLCAFTGDGRVWWQDKFERRAWITAEAWLRWAGDEVQPQ